jgi:Protein of unknown function (DUF4238)/SEC-C motif
MGKKEITRDNHYVPEWYQKGFIPAGQGKLHYLDMTPDPIHLQDGRTKYHRSLFQSYPSMCFYQTDLYSTFFGHHVNDEVEKMLFGELDRRGAPAIKAFIGDDVADWHRHFTDLFLYLDAQKIRTPKGLDWLRARYPRLDQNDLMVEMQGIRTVNCTIWTECVREIVSARGTEAKFIITDHPVTIYNKACPPDHALCQYPVDPSITQKASQTLFPLDQEHCLILTNLEYAQDPDGVDPIEKRTFARHVRKSLVRTDKFIRVRDLDEARVTAINHVLKSRAKRFIAAGRREDLWPEKSFEGSWNGIGAVLMPPADELWHYGGEIYVGYEDGSVAYQDAFGRTSPASKAHAKSVDEAKLGVNDLCGCGSGKKYKKCCKAKPKALRPSWSERSIRERNIAFYRGISDILGLNQGKDWGDVRRELDEEKVKDIHVLHGALWPIETDIFDLLPKPDGEARALYAGLLDPRTTGFSVANACLYFGTVLVQNPFTHPRQVNKEFSPVENPHSYLVQTLKDLSVFLQLAPLIDSGHVNLFPDPASLDPHLQRTVMELAHGRGKGASLAPRDVEVMKRLQHDDLQHMLCMLPEVAQEAMIRRATPAITEDELRKFQADLAHIREHEPFVLLRDGVYGGGQDGGQLTLFHNVPNFEMVLMIAQATGAFVVTDSHHRWEEMRKANHRSAGIVLSRIPDTEACAPSVVLPVCEDVRPACALLGAGKLHRHRLWAEKLAGTLSDMSALVDDDAMLAGHGKAVSGIEKEFGERALDDFAIRLRIMAPVGGIYHNHVPRLMVRSGLEGRPDRLALAVLMDIETR